MSRYRSEVISQGSNLFSMLCLTGLTNFQIRFETACHLVAHTVQYLYDECHLETFRADDARIPGIRSSLCNKIQQHLSTVHVDSYVDCGLWVRKTQEEIDQASDGDLGHSLH